MSEWQPIDSAPKDRPVLIYAGGFDEPEVFVAWYDATAPRTKDQPYGPFVWVTDGGGVAERCATHWAEIPEPPQ